GASQRKKRTQFSKCGAADAEIQRHNAGMKTQEILSPATSAGIALKRILAPVDFSPLSKKALQYAVRLAQEFNAEVSLFHVIEPEIPPAFDGYMIAPPPISNGTGPAMRKPTQSPRQFCPERRRNSRRLDCSVRP